MFSAVQRWVLKLCLAITQAEWQLLRLEHSSGYVFLTGSCTVGVTVVYEPVRSCNPSSCQCLQYRNPLNTILKRLALGTVLQE